MSYLNVVDLAGSERRDKNLNPGDKASDKENLSKNLTSGIAGGKPPLLMKYTKTQKVAPPTKSTMSATEIEQLNNEAKFIN